ARARRSSGPRQAAADRAAPRRRPRARHRRRQRRPAAAALVRLAPRRLALGLLPPRADGVPALRAAPRRPRRERGHRRARLAVPQQAVRRVVRVGPLVRPQGWKRRTAVGLAVDLTREDLAGAMPPGAGPRDAT